MVFNSAGFLFLFLPVSLVLYRLVPGRAGKAVLLSALSLVFYGFGGFGAVPVLLLSAAWNWAFGRLLSRRADRALLAVGAAGNLALLGVYKYLAFLLGIFGLPSPVGALALPLGISFFTFHGVSYLADVYRGRAEAERRFHLVFLYLAFFPRLIAGPIVRWQDAASAMEPPPASWEDTAAGLRRFVRGMVKKLILSEGAAAVANGVYALAPDSLGAGLAWCGALAYCLQIFFDFSGYSDMAVGLGRCFGYTLPENFDYPYVSGTVTEFWRRWHMTLNRWFVDYLYIPLGGSRRGLRITVRNTLIVFFFTGLWHGAGWTFLIWGLWHGLFVSLERLGRDRLERCRESVFGRAALHVYTLLVVLIGFVMFRASSPGQGLMILGRMFSFASAGTAGRMAAEGILTADRLAAMGLGILFSLPVVPALRKRLASGDPLHLEIAGDALALAGLALSVLAISGGSFSPFIYQQF